jgi:hypothetical protein
MPNLDAVLDVVIGLAFVYLSLAIICTVVNEWISGVLNSRGKLLEQGIRELLDNQAHPDAPAPGGAAAGAGTAGPGTAAAGAASGPSDGFLTLFYQHSLLTEIRHQGGMTKNRHESYLDPRTFAQTVMDVAAVGKAGVMTVQELQAAVQSLPDGDVKKALLALMQTAGDDISQVEKNIEAWFNGAMSRLAGFYKRTVQIWTLVVAVLVAVLLNASTVSMSRSLWRDPSVRAVVVAQAEALARADVNASSNTRAGTAANAGTAGAAAHTGAGTATGAHTGSGVPVGLTTQELAAIGDLLGWENPPESWLDWLIWLGGIALTVAAVSLGAPFWFDTLKRFVNLRPAGKAPED